MKKLLLGSVALAAMIAGPAMAADMPAKARPLPPPDVWNWGGVYMGSHIGGGWARTSYWSDFNCTVGVLCDSISHDPNGWLAGGQFGARWQWGALVLGVEGSLSAAWIRESSPSTCTPGVNTCIGIPGNFGVDYTTTVNKLFTATGSIGYAWDRTLLYVKGGWAGGEVARTVTDSLLPGAFHGGITQRASGWTVGGGIEWGIVKTTMAKVSLGIEYDYYRLDAGSFLNNAINSATGAIAFPVNTSAATVDLHQVVARANVTVDWCTLWTCGPVR